MEDTHIEPAPSGDVEQPAADAAEQPQVETDVWTEEFDSTNEPQADDDNNVETDTEPDTADEEPEVIDEASQDDESDYVTEGLGELDCPLVLKHKGTLYDIKNLDELRELAEKGLGAQVKFQEIAKDRTTLELMSDHDISSDDIAELVKMRRGEIQPDDLKEYLDTSTTQVNEIAQGMVDAEYFEDVKGITRLMSDNDREMFGKSPELMRMLKVDMEAGVGSKIRPRLLHLINVNNMSFIEAYKQAGAELIKVRLKKDTQKKRLKKAPKRGSVDKAEPQKDAWDMSDDDFQNIMSRGRR